MFGAKTMGVFTAGAAAGCAVMTIGESAPEATAIVTASAEILRDALETSPDHEAIVERVSLAPSATIPSHYHPGEEIVYVIHGSITHVEDGKDNAVYGAGDAFLIRKGKSHAPIAGEDGVRAVVFRVHPAGEPVRYAAE